MNKTLHIQNIDGMNCAERIVKRAVDIIGSFLGLILLSPLFAVIYLLIKSEGDGPVIFSQERIGKGGRPFRIYKFRTMVVNAESDGAVLLKKKMID